MDTRVFTHSLHGGVDVRRDDVLNRGSLLACAGRVVAIAQSSAIDFYDASDVTDTSNVLGDGTCKLHFICTAPITDITSPVTVLSVAFLHGGLLAVCGSCSRGTVVHAYKLAFTSTNADKRPFSTDVAYAAAPSLATHALPRLVFRAALPAGSVVHLLPHPTVVHTLGVLVAGDSAVRFYDCTPASDAVVPALLDCTAGVVAHPTDSPVTRACISRDGHVLAVATEGREIALYRLLSAPMQGTSRTLLRGEHHLSYVYGAGAGGTGVGAGLVSALMLMRVPVPREAERHARFRMNGYALVTGHTDGTVNVWWPGDVCDLQSVGGGTGAGAAAGEYRVARPGSLGAPLASYPAFHASRGPILHLSPAVAAEEGGDGPGSSIPRLLRRVAGSDYQEQEQAQAMSTAYSAVCVGAHGARGWRMLIFPHKPLQPGAAVQASAARMQRQASMTTAAVEGGAGGTTTRSALASSSTLSSPTLGARWGYDSAGHRVLLPPPAEDVSHLLYPYFTCPSFTDVVASPVLGDAQGLSAHPATAASSGGMQLSMPSLLVQTPLLTGPGIEPRGAFLLQRYPSADGALLCAGGPGGRDVVTGSVYDAGVDARKIFPGLPPSSLSLDTSLFSLLAREYGGNVLVHGMATSPPGVGGGASTAGKQGETFSFTAAEDAGPRRAGVGASFKYLPRTVVLLLTERGLHISGLDWHRALHAPGARVEAQAARALGYPALLTEHGESALVPSSDPFFGGFAPYAHPPGASPQGRDALPPTAHVHARAQRLQQAQEEELAESATKAVRRARAEMSAHAARRAARVARLPQHVHVSPPTLPPSPHSHSTAPRPRLKTAWPMSITGRQDSIIRGARAVFQEETLVGALSRGLPGAGRQSEVLHAIPAQAQKLLADTAFSSGFVQAEKVAARAVQEETARRTAAKMAYLPRHSAARLARKQQGVAASGSSAAGVGEASGGTSDPSAHSIGRTVPLMSHPLQPWAPSTTRRASSPLVPHGGPAYGQGQGQAQAQADTASVDMSIEEGEEGEEGLLAQLAAMKAHLAAVQVEFRERTRKIMARE